MTFLYLNIMCQAFSDLEMIKLKYTKEDRVVKHGCFVKEKILVSSFQTLFSAI